MKSEQGILSVRRAVQLRRAVKTFDPRHRLPEEQVRDLLEHAILSPTAFNVQNWRLVRVRDPALRREIRGLAWDQAQVTDASLLVILCMDLKAWQRDPRRYVQMLPSKVQDMLLASIRDYYQDNPARRAR